MYELAICLVATFIIVAGVTYAMYELLNSVSYSFNSIVDNYNQKLHAELSQAQKEEGLLDWFKSN